MQPWDRPSSTLASAAALEPSRLRTWALRTVKECAIQDWLVLGYHIALCYAAFQGSGPMRETCVIRMLCLLLLMATTVVVVRGSLLRSHFWAPMLYRWGVYGSVQLSYFTLRDLLPTATSRAYDDALYHLDVKIFGVEPTLWADKFVSHATTEWFSFFYFNYFLLLAVHVLPFLFLSRRHDLFAEFALSILAVFCTAHILYMIVPGFGPYRELASLYRHELPHGTWYDLVVDAVKSAGAMKDIFPSLHTAAPTTLALFSFRHRDKLPFKYTWPIVSLFASNIIGATIFLRWHYLVDVLAGLTLASVVTLVIVPRARAWERTRRDREGLGPEWPAFGWGWVDWPRRSSSSS